jgi:hypothetical protein
MRRAIATVAAVLAIGAAGCGPPTKHEILEKAEGAETRQDLESRLGAPDDRSKLGPIETWKYVAKDGEVTFLIAGDRVRFETAGDAEDPKSP